jgi:hypothetical protein
MVARSNWLATEAEVPYGIGQGLRDLYGGYQSGKKSKRDEEKELLDNALTHAKVNNERMNGGLSSLSGVAGQVASLHRLKNQFGENSPTYQRALKAFELDQAHTQETMDSSKFYRENPWRLYDPTTKGLQAQQQAAQGRFPEGGQAYETPAQQQQAVDIYEKERYGKNTPTFLQQQYEAAQQIDETIKLIDPDKAFPYSGVRGAAELWKDRYESQNTGKISEKYAAFEENETYLHNLREQIRSYLGSSITQEMTKDLDYLVNPSNWMSHPEIAKRKYKAVIRAYENEKAVTERAIKHGNPSAPNPIFGVENKQAKPHQSEAQKIGLNPPPETFTKENILKAAKTKKWSDAKTQFVLKHYGFS